LQPNGVYQIRGFAFGYVRIREIAMAYEELASLPE
jgi:hypothetical protein